ncbi:hypothetical protein E1A91_D05G202500v1 [Gossypium mustelinum]|uniref:Auxin response factor n=1 Tax=Gossypium mustelinum TaxID=34275 RepID=A0A5D2UYN6_GOSMU|nr:hypothetical protein E1A91_D05G202500v1 [Gossypium mustelinum]
MGYLFLIIFQAEVFTSEHVNVESLLCVILVRVDCKASLKGTSLLEDTPVRVMGSFVEEKMKTGVFGNGWAEATLLEEMKLLKEMQHQSGSRKAINSELWHACAGPLVSLPQVGNLVYYFPQGHSEQVSVSTKRMMTSQVPNYPNLQSQLMCQVHNVTLHADTETDEVYAQMSLQPVNSEKDVFNIPDFGVNPNKHPNEIFCKTLTASDTSTHGGFSVPRRAAEKLFPQLDYTMQPPSQELVMRDIHDNTWTFRHIYRGQPKRHLLTTGWSSFVGSKRLRAGDSILFIRDEKSQLLVGIRHANRHQATLPSSVLSADSMHIGVLAAAAQAAANRTPFTIFYNPRSCPSEFVIPMAKYCKSVYATQVSAGMRFGMMFETEESGKRRYMGTIVGISDLDPLRWPGSKWRNLQVEWDEPGCHDKQNRVSPWEVETPESLFIFPSINSGLKRPYPWILGAESEWGNLINRPLLQFPENGSGNLPYPISNSYSKQLMKMMLKPHLVNHPGTFSSTSQQISAAKGSPLNEMKNVQYTSNQEPQLMQSENLLIEKPNPSQLALDQPDPINSNLLKINANGNPHPANEFEGQTQARCNNKKLKSEPEHSTDQLSQLNSTLECTEEKLVVNTISPTICNKLSFPNNNQTPSQLQNNPCPIQSQFEPSLLQAHQMQVSQADISSLSSYLPFFNTDEWATILPSCQSIAGVYGSPGPIPLVGLQDSSAAFPEATNPTLTTRSEVTWDSQLYNCRSSSQANELCSFAQQDPCSFNSGGIRDLSDDSNSKSGIYSCFSNNGSTVIDPSVSNVILEELCSLKDAKFQKPSDSLVGNFSCSQDVQSQITSASLADSRVFSRQDLPDSSGVTSSSNVDFDENGLLQKTSWQQITPRLRTYTKVQKAGSVGRSIDVTSYKNYDKLLSAIECMFGLKGLLKDPRGSGWKLVYVDHENDVLLVGDDPWEQFVGCVRCIRILSPTEVQQMSEEGMKLLNRVGSTVQGPISEVCNAPPKNEP